MSDAPLGHYFSHATLSNRFLRTAMSDLAPLVAATLRDKVVAELLLENEKLKEKLRASRKVTITGRNGTPVYAEGQFEDGMFADNPNLWRVDVNTTDRCRLSEFEFAEIRIGGICKAIVEVDCAEGFFEENSISLGRLYFFLGGSGAVWLDVQVIHPETEDLTNIIDENVNSDDLLSHLVDLGDSHPEMYVEFKYLNFVNSSINGFIEQLDLSEQVIAEADKRRAEIFAIGTELLRDTRNDENH